VAVEAVEEGNSAEHDGAAHDCGTDELGGAPEDAAGAHLPVFYRGPA
jgi:hypothetical protein